MIGITSPVERGEDWTLINGDCIEEMGKMAEGSVDLSVYSPPFMSLYTYTASARDIGNCASAPEFFEHLGFMIREMARVTKPGRLTCVHVAQVPAMLSRDGHIGMKDFRGRTIDAYEAKKRAEFVESLENCEHMGDVGNLVESLKAKP